MTATLTLPTLGPVTRSGSARCAERLIAGVTDAQDGAVRRRARRVCGGGLRRPIMGDALNLAARLMSEARSDEAVVSNTFYTRLAPERHRLFEEVEPIEAKNVGRIQGWRTTHRALASTPGAR